jgi:tetratricopeptide (TPR) repeat protein
VADSNEKIFVARESDLQVLRDHFAAAREGDGRTVILQAPLGGGKRALVGEMARSLAAAEDDVIVWRLAFTEEEDGLRALLRLYATLYSLLHRAPLLRTRVEMVLNAQLPQHPKRVQQWFSAFIDGLKKGPKPGEETFQVSLPRDNPLLGLIEIVLGISRKIPILLDVQSVNVCHSVGVFALLEALMQESRGKARLLVLLSTESPEDPRARAAMPAPWLEFLDRRKADLHTLALAPWGENEARAFLASKGYEGVDVAGLVEVTGGLPGFVAEVAEYLQAEERLGEPLAGRTLAELVPTAMDAGALGADGEAGGEAEEPDEDGQPAPKRRRATVEDAPVAQLVTALLGHSFPSVIAADVMGVDRDSMDDLLDACDGLYKEEEYHKQLKSWIYSFQRPFFRFGVLMAHRDDAGRQRTARVGAFLERFLAPRGHEFLVRTLRTYAEAGEAQRCLIVKSMALTADRPEMWGMCHELVQTYQDIAWPVPLRRTVFMNLLERMINGGQVEPAEKLFNEAIQWASGQDDRAMQAWVLFAGSRLDYRRQDLYRARDRARDALTLYRGLEDALKTAEVLGHLAMIELSDGNPTAALEQADAAEKAHAVPPIQAQAEYVRGLVARRDRKLEPAIEHFRKANEYAGQAGVGPLALEAGINLGETLLAAGQAPRAADVLGRCIAIAQGMRNPLRERAAAAMLAQAQSAQKNHEAALRAARRVLEITEALGLKQFLPIDTYNVGLFSLMAGKVNEAVALFRKAQEGLNPDDVMLAKELYFNLGGALKSIGELSEAARAFEACLGPATQTKDVRKLVVARAELGDIAQRNGDVEAAKRYLKAALEDAEKAELKEERKQIKRRLEALG